MHPARERKFLFLGGPISGLAVGLCAPPAEQRVLPWFAVLPLFLSLWRHAERPGLRAFHGLSFGAILGAVVLDRSDPLRFGLQLGSAGFWAMLFAVVSGPLFRCRNAGVCWIGLPSLWTGLGAVREFLANLGLPPAHDFMPLCLAVAPDAPEASIVRAVGALGLSWILTLPSAMFLVAFRESRGLRQAAFALGAAAVPVLCVAAGKTGSLVEPRGAPSAGLLLVVPAGGDPAPLLSVSRRSEARPPDIVFWTRMTPGKPSPDSGRLKSAPEALKRFLSGTECRLIVSEGEKGSRAGRTQGFWLLEPLDRVVFRSQGRNFFGAVAQVMPIRGAWVAAADDGILFSTFGMREAVRRGANIFVLSAPVDVPRSEQGLRARLQSLRALELGRWIMRSTPSSAVAVNSLGRIALQIDGEGAGLVDASLLGGMTFYARFGWWVEAAFGIFALSVTALVGALAAFRLPYCKAAPPCR